MSTLAYPVVPEQSRRRTAHLAPVASRPEPRWGPVVIRLATAGDRSSLERLAQLDSSTSPSGETVIGELHGRPVVAISLTDGTVIADPFVATGDVLELVRLRARQLTA